MRGARGDRKIHRDMGFENKPKPTQPTENAVD
jgi:hypothetical protein